MRKRFIELKFRLSPEEYEQLQDKLKEAGLSRNMFLVRLITDATIYPKGHLRELNEKYHVMNSLLRGMATNINQIAKVANSSHYVPNTALLVEMQQDVKTIQGNLQPLWEETRKVLWQS